MFSIIREVVATLRLAGPIRKCSQMHSAFEHSMSDTHSLFMLSFELVRKGPL